MFKKEAFAFLDELAANNDRAWFKANQGRFEELIREPALAFIEDVAIWFEAEKLQYEAVPKKAGGSLGRIHRDTRFSNDKTPYHTHVMFHFGHRDATPDRPKPTFGIRIRADEVGVGGGVWSGPSSVLNKIRDGIVADPAGWDAATAGLKFDADALKTAPRGYDKEHSHIDALRLTGYAGHVMMSKQDVTGDFLAAVQAKGAPVLRYCSWLDERLS